VAEARRHARRSRYFFLGMALRRYSASREIARDEVVLFSGNFADLHHETFDRGNSEGFLGCNGLYHLSMLSIEIFMACAQGFFL
jgi:hypothetical protein